MSCRGSLTPAFLGSSFCEGQGAIRNGAPDRAARPVPESHPRPHQHLAQALIVRLRRLPHPEHERNRAEDQPQRDVAAHQVIEPDRQQEGDAADQDQWHDRYAAQHRGSRAAGENGIAKAVHVN